jgi:hypothetical protein
MAQSFLIRPQLNLGVRPLHAPMTDSLTKDPALLALIDSLAPT